MQSSGSYFENLVIFAACLVVSITVHEYMHGLVAFKQGDDTAHNEGRLTLNPLKSVDPVYSILLPLITYMVWHAPILAAKPVPVTPWKLRDGAVGMAKVGIAGPLSNLLMAFLGAALFKILSPSGMLENILMTFIGLNVGLFAFNIIPIPPLDGSRVLYAVLPEVGRDLMDRVEPYGFFLVIILATMGAFGGILSTMYSFIMNLLF